MMDRSLRLSSVLQLCICYPSLCGKEPKDHPKNVFILKRFPISRSSVSKPLNWWRTITSNLQRERLWIKCWVGKRRILHSPLNACVTRAKTGYDDSDVEEPSESLCRGRTFLSLKKDWWEGVSTEHLQHSWGIMVRAKPRFAKEVSQHQLFDRIWPTNNGPNSDFGVTWMDLLCLCSAPGFQQGVDDVRLPRLPKPTPQHVLQLNIKPICSQPSSQRADFSFFCFSCRHECCLLSDLSTQLLKKMRIFFSVHRRRLGHITENVASFISFQLTSNKAHGSWGRGRAGQP